MTPPEITPELLTKARQKVQDARAAGFSDAEIDAYLLDEIGQGLKDVESPTVRDYARAAGEGLTANFLDELAGVGAAVVPGGKGYAEARDEVRANSKAARAVAPKRLAAAEIAGTLPWLLVPGGQAATVGGAIRAGATAGAATGLLSGFGAGEGAGDSAGKAVAGGVFGGLLGGATGGGTALWRATRPAAMARRTVGEAVAQDGGVDAVRNKVTNLGRLTGEEPMLLDAGPGLRAEGNVRVNQSARSYSAAQQKIEARNAKEGEHVLDAVRKRIGDPNAEGRVKQLDAATRAEYDPKYQALREVYGQVGSVEFGKALGDFTQQPKVADAWREATKTGMIGATPDGGMPSFAHVQDFKRAVEDMRDAAFRSGMNNRAIRFGEVADATDEFLRKNVEGYADITAGYAGRKQLVRSVEEGQDLWRTADGRKVETRMAALDQIPEQAAEARVGMGSEMLSQLQSRQTNRSLATELLNMSPSDKTKMRALMGPRFDSFTEILDALKELRRANKVIGGSDSALRIQGSGVEAGDVLAAGATAGPGGALAAAGNAAVGGAVRGLRKNAQRKANELMADMLIKNGPELDALLRQFERPMTAAGRMATRAAPIAGTRAAGLLLGF